MTSQTGPSTPLNGEPLSVARDDLQIFRAQLLSQVDEKIKNSQWYIGHLVYIFVGFFTFIGIVVGFGYLNFRDERTKIDDYLQTKAPESLKKFTDAEIAARGNFEARLEKQFVGKSEEATLALYYRERGEPARPLDGREVSAEIVKNDSNAEPWILRFYYIIRNQNDTIVPSYQAMLYVDDENFSALRPNSDDTLPYKYETDITYEDRQSDHSIPGRYSTSIPLNIRIVSKKRPVFDHLRVMLKLFYGKGKSVPATIYISAR